MQTASNPWWSIYRCIAQVLKGSPGIRARRFHLAMPKKIKRRGEGFGAGGREKNRRKTEIGSLGIGRVVLIGRWQKKLSCGGKELAPARKKHGVQKKFCGVEENWRQQSPFVGGSVRWRQQSVGFHGGLQKRGVLGFECGLRWLM